MKTFFTALSGLLSRAWVWSLLLLLGCGLLVWVVGPHLAFDDYRPWAETPARLLTLCALALVWGLFLVFSGWRQTRSAKAALMADEQDEPQKPVTPQDHAGLRLRFRQAQRTLSKARLYGGRNERWRKALPWYVLLGPQGSGKTSLLEYSTLNLPLNPRQNKAATPPAPTADCDWYFAEQGVLLDTCGDYLSQKNDASICGWGTLLKLVGRHRRSKPINGVLITLPVSLLSAEDSKPLDAFADQVRERLEEIHRHLHSQSPVYLVLSKADQIRGFDSFYRDISQEQSRQALGFNFSDADSIDATVLALKFDELLSHLGSQVVERTRRETQGRRVARLVDFPRQLGMLVAPLAGFMDKAFGGNRFQPGNPVRGVYLTSAPHLREPKKTSDNLSGLSENLLLRDASKPGKMHGQPRFIHDLLTRIVFPEAGLATLDKKQIRRIRWQQVAMCGAALGCIGLLATMWAKGFSHNDERLSYLNRLGEQLARDRLTTGAQDQAFAVLPRLESSHAALQLFSTESPGPLTRLMKLDQNGATQPFLLSAYRHELQSQLLPRIAHQLANRLRADLNHRDQLLNSLRAYLMLDDQGHRDTAFLRGRVTAEWRSGYAATPADQQKLGAHLSRLLEQPVRIKLDSGLIEQARQALRDTPVTELTYQALKEKTSTLPDYHLQRQVDPYGTLFNGGDYAIPGFYTRKSYQRYFLAQGLSLVQESQLDDWVMGENGMRSVGEMKALMVELEQLYLRDYADHWSQAIAELQLLSLDSSLQAAEQAALITAANSPLLKLLVEIRDNTRFEKPEEPLDAAAKVDISTLAKVATGVAEQAKSALLDQLPNNAKIALQRRFELIHQLLDEDNNPTIELTTALQALNNLYLQLATVARSSQPEHAAFDLAKSRMSGQLDTLSMLRTSSARLPQPLNNWLRALAEDSWRLLLADAYRHINQRYQSELYSVYSEGLAKRYPFHATSESDVAIADFRDFFKAQGVAERFFDAYLKPFIKGENGHYTLRSVDGRSLPMSPNTLAQMSRIQVIRRSFFNETPEQPRVKFRLEPYSLDQNLSRADFQFGDKQLEYRHGPIVPLALQWPSETDNSIASLIVEHPSGRRVGYQENSGPWSLFRLIERLESEPHSGRDVLMLKASLEGRKVNYLLMSQRSPNPFELEALREFRLPAVL